jgi:hypothetical protein
VKFFKCFGSETVTSGRVHKEITGRIKSSGKFDHLEKCFGNGKCQRKKICYNIKVIIDSYKLMK